MSSTAGKQRHIDEQRKLPDGWRWVKLGDVARLVNGRAYRADELLDRGKYPVLRVGNLFTSDHWYYSDLELDPEKYCDRGDLLYAWSASFGSFIWSGPKVVFHYHIWKVDCGDNLDAGYARHALEVITTSIKADSHGLAMLHMTKDGMGQFEIPLPPLDEQRRIAAVLCEQMADVEYARTAAQARLAAIKAMPVAFLRQVFPETNQQLPAGWRWVRLGEVLRLRNDIVHPHDFPSGPAVFVGLEHIEPDTGKRIGAEQIEMSKLKGRKPKFYKGDIIYGYLRPYLNKVWVAEFDGLCSVDQYAYGIDSKTNVPEYLALFMRSPVYVENSVVGKTPGWLPRIRKEEVASVIAPLPPLPEQRRIAEALYKRMTAVEKARAATEAELDAINALPAALLRRAFSGQL